MHAGGLFLPVSGSVPSCSLSIYQYHPCTYAVQPGAARFLISLFPCIAQSVSVLYLLHGCAYMGCKALPVTRAGNHSPICALMGLGRPEESDPCCLIVTPDWARNADGTFIRFYNPLPFFFLLFLFNSLPATYCSSKQRSLACDNVNRQQNHLDSRCLPGITITNSSCLSQPWMYNKIDSLLSIASYMHT